MEKLSKQREKSTLKLVEGVLSGDKKQAIKALLNGEGAINMVVRRRKSLGGKVVTPLHINLSGHKGRGRGDG